MKPSPRPNSYGQTQWFSATIGGQPIRWAGRPGVAGWDALDPAGLLLYEAIECRPAAHILLLGCGHGAVGAALARRVPAGRVLLADTSWIALDLACQTLVANGVGNTQVAADPGPLPAHAGAFDAVALLAPTDRRLARRQLLESWHALAAGGTLYLAGANDHGIRSVIADAAALFGNAALLSYRRGCRVASAMRQGTPTPPAWAGTPGIAPGSWIEYTATLRGQTLQICSLPGVFSAERLDEGTRVLLETFGPGAGGRVLDLGCGSGVIGALAARLGATHADLVDSNLLAVAAANATLARNQIDNARAFAADGIPPGQQYDLVISNPPFHLGKAIDYAVAHAFIAQATQALRPGGRLALVANQFLPYEQLLRPAFATLELLAQRAGYRVWLATR